MTVTFPNASHISTVWLPQLHPTEMTVASMVIGLAFVALLMAGIAVMFAVVCLQRAFTWRLASMTLGVCLLALLALAGISGRVTNTYTTSSLPSVSKAGALATAREDAEPPYAWQARSKPVSSSNRVVQTDWQPADLQNINHAVESMKGVTKAFATSNPTIDTAHNMTNSYIAAHGTTYLHGSSKLRCVVELGQTTKNNVGQPLTTVINQVRCQSPTA